MLTFDGFDGPKQITSLPFFPFRYHDSIQDVSERLEKRGRDFRKLCTAKKGEQMFQYKGPAFMRRRIPMHFDAGVSSWTNERLLRDIDGHRMTMTVRTFLDGGLQVGTHRPRLPCAQSR